MVVVLPKQFEVDLAEQRFRVVTVDNQRRGIRLEEIYWIVLAELAQDTGRRLSDIVAACANGGGNLTANLRLEAISHLRQQSLAAKERARIEVVVGQVLGCPSAAFALSEDKRIIAYNPPFLSFIQSRFLRLPQKALAQGLKLSLDVHFVDLVKQLKNAPNEPRSVAFTLGVNEQATRGKLNAVLAPMAVQDAIIGYILP